MCGIAGLASREPWAEAGRVATALARNLEHRGPDGEGFWISGPHGSGIRTSAGLEDVAQTVLVHRRLSIVDLENGQQPMTNEDESAWVTFNGEIYNQAA